jgi:hypothetical protein
MKRIALCFRGLHTFFPQSYLNIKEMILDDLRKSYDVDIFLHTYKTFMSERIEEELNPVAVIYKEPCDSQSSMQVIVPLQIFECCSLIENIEKEYDISYDFILITRFDLSFHQPFSTYDIQYEKINMECLFVPDNNAGDNFLFFKRQYIDLVKNSIEQCMKDKDISHQLHKYYEKNGAECHYICGTTTKRNREYDVMFRFTRYLL